jgi:hypothetical protein
MIQSDIAIFAISMVMVLLIALGLFKIVYTLFKVALNILW